MPLLLAIHLIITVMTCLILVPTFTAEYRDHLSSKKEFCKFVLTLAGFAFTPFFNVFIFLFVLHEDYVAERNKRNKEFLYAKKPYLKSLAHMDFLLREFFSAPGSTPFDGIEDFSDWIHKKQLMKHTISSEPESYRELLCNHLPVFEQMMLVYSNLRDVDTETYHHYLSNFRQVFDLFYEEYSLI